jgi:hypothetical protein
MPKVVVLVLPLLLASCSGADAKAAADAKNPAKAQPQNALPSDLTPSDGPQATGTVEETLDAGGYTYVRLKTPGGEVWAAVAQAVLAKGSEITVGNAMWMENFESKTLNRKFDRILFGSVATAGGTAGLPPGHPATTTAAVPSAADTGDVKVEKAIGQGARTVAEIYAAKATLKGTEVLVRGKVVKFNPEIMGRNWIHLRDGSGSADKKDNDITVTTTDVVAKGDIVTIRGKVALDQDFTAGYAYPVIIEGAKVVK